MSWLDRTELLLGSDKLGKLKGTHVLVVGLGGVGAWAAELLCRAGVGKMTIVDGDVIEETNRNRQLPALASTNGKQKAEVLAERFRDINPKIELIVYNEFLKDEKTIELLENKNYDYVVDAIDTLTPKVFLIYNTLRLGYPIISSMGAGGKTDPSLVEVCDLSKSYKCRLARMIRKRLSKFGVKSGVTVVFSPEKVPEEVVRIEKGQNKKSVVGTISYMPPLFGCHLAAHVIRELTS